LITGPEDGWSHGPKDTIEIQWIFFHGNFMETIHVWRHEDALFKKKSKYDKDIISGIYLI
jgi:hypothetical protein